MILIIIDEPRESKRPDGWSVPTDYEMYIPQIRSIGQYSETRCSVCSGLEHIEREDLHFLVVLVLTVGSFVCLCHHLLGTGCHVANNSWSNYQAPLPKRDNEWSWRTHQQYSGKNELDCYLIFFSFAEFAGNSELIIHFSFQVGDFLLLHLLGQNISVNAFSEILRELCNRLSSSTPSAPSPMEMAPFYSSALENEKETMT